MTEPNTKTKRSFFKYRLKKQYRLKFRLGLIVIFILTSVAFLYAPVTRKVDTLLHPKAYGTIKVDWYKDYNATHLNYASRNGITPIKTNKAFHAEVKNLMDKGKLEKIKSNRYFVVQRLTFSHPYLTPKTVDLLEDIGKRFNKNLNDAGLGKYAYQISSVLRTQESQNKLRGTNKNATTNMSSHYYGTTVDIAYETVFKRPLPWLRIEVADARAIKILSETIGELRKEGRCVVVTERKEKCFHLTVAN